MAQRANKYIINFSTTSKLIILTLILMVLSFLSIYIFGKNCTLEFTVNNPDNITVNYDENIVECLSQQIDNNNLTLEFRSVSKGVAQVEVSDDNGSSALITQLYVHPLGNITINNFFGKCRGDILFSASFNIILTVLCLTLCRKYIASTKVSLCRYSNAWLLGVIIFIIFLILFHLQSFVIQSSKNENPSVLDLLEGTILSAQLFTTFLFPIAIIISFAISISNLVLMKNEGICFNNMLGFLLGIALCVGTIAPHFIYPLLDLIGVNIHRYSSIFVLLENCIEDLIAIVMAYFECILIGTAFSAVRSAKHIPKFDKDYILILGCQIREDGGLTKLLQSRTDRAIKFAEMQKKQTGKEIVFVPSGGKGDDEIISEADAIRNYLVSTGIPERQILVENKSASTNQNIRFSYKLIKEKNTNPKIAFSTTNYHVFRAGCIADELGIEVEGIGAKTKPYFWINAFIREFIATLHYEKKSHIKALLIIVASTLPIESIIFISFLR